MKRLFTFVFITAVLWLMWLAFAGSLDPQEMIAGALVAVMVTLLRSGGPCLLGGPEILHPRRVLYALLYLPFMVWSIIMANLDVARRILSPRLAINPGIVKVKTRLQSPVGRMILANSITLTPGTLSVDIAGDDMYIHWVDVESRDAEAASQKIAAGFEKYLEVIFG
ncbi:MAG: Na+/H+ antiporter subunit E [Candidatus Krumholzibacteriota bacterium]